jgi:tripartite-type tricarboxylate transporter receptor subunit TctC
MKSTSIFRLIASVAGLAALVLSSAPLSVAAAYPERPITLIIPWAAGGGTDATGRIIASIMEKELGVAVAVGNRTGGSGVVGHVAIADAAPDGYTIGVITVEINQMHWQGLTDLTYEAYTPIGQYNSDPAGVQVGADSPYQTAQSLLDAIRGAEAGKFKASGTGQGGIWHLALAGMLNSVGIDPNAVRWVPSKGSAPALIDLVAGGVGIVACSLPEAKSMIDAGRVKSLVVMDAERSPSYPDVPTLKEATGSDWAMGTWRGIAGPKGLPQDVTDKLVQTLEKAVTSDQFKELMNSRGFGIRWRNPEEFRQFLAQNDEDLGKVMKVLGLAK